MTAGRGLPGATAGLHVAGRQGGLVVEVFPRVVENVAQNSGNGDGKVPREARLGRLRTESPYFMFG